LHDSLRTKFVVNTTAGRGRAGKMLDHIKLSLREYGIPEDVVLTERPRQATELAFTAAMDGYDRVVAVGGDGTAVEVTTGLLQAQAQGRRPVLGVIPAGSGNDFAFGMGINGDLDAACRRLVEGERRAVDLVRVNVDGEETVLINAVGVGYDADVLLATRKMKALRGFVMYLLGVFQVWASWEKWPYPARITADGVELGLDRVTLVTVSNGPRSGGGFFLNPDADTGDGLFDVCVAREVNRLEIFPLLLKVMKGTHVNSPQVKMLRARHLVIESLRPTGLPGHLDGEVLCTDGKRIEFEIMPRALSVWS
jgi:diacylglycerol kinase (ATP)